jgi:RNA polymerase sigma factor for flagellar operon FliA
MLDDRRRSDHVSRGVRRRVRDLAAATAQLTQRLGRAPAERELASHLGVSVETLWRWREATEAATTCPAEEPRSRGAAAGGALAPSDLAQLATPETDAPDAALEREERAATLRAAIQRLEEQDRAVLGMYYFEEIPMREIGRVLSLTESRISQIHKRALRHLRAAMTEPSTPALAPAA